MGRRPLEYVVGEDVVEPIGRGGMDRGDSKPMRRAGARAAGRMRSCDALVGRLFGRQEGEGDSHHPVFAPVASPPVLHLENFHPTRVMIPRVGAVRQRRAYHHVDRARAGERSVRPALALAAHAAEAEDHAVAQELAGAGAARPAGCREVHGGRAEPALKQGVDDDEEQDACSEPALEQGDDDDEEQDACREPALEQGDDGDEEQDAATVAFERDGG
ncbi:hypothetical protein HK101_002928 [Irineochytrium annulatum]|nr:hypothetical protein HK101_002928 [Irineochytrium annulatum]